MRDLEAKAREMYLNGQEAWRRVEELNARLGKTEKALADTEKRLHETGQKLADTEKALADAERRLHEVLVSKTWRYADRIRRIANTALPRGSVRREAVKVPYRLSKAVLHIGGGDGTKVREIRNSKWPADRPLLSVVIPCFNYGEYVEEAIDSVLAQTFRNLEIIVVEGGSTDNYTVQKLKALNRPSTTVYFREGPHLVGDNRNFGIQRARGKYICCLDADDKLKPTYLEKALFIAEAFNYDIVHPSVQCFGGSDLVWEAGEAKFPEIAEGNMVSTVAVFKKEAWERAGGYKDWGLGHEHIPEDWEFWTRLVGMGCRARRVVEPLMLYRVHGNGLTAANKRSLEEQVITIKKENARLFEEKNLRRLEKIGGKNFLVKDPFINLTQGDGGARNILFALPFMIIGGADTILLQIAGYLSKNNYRISCITTVPADKRWGDNTPIYSKITDEIYHLNDFLKPREEWREFIFYLIEVKKIDILFIVGCEYVYHLLPEIRSRFPGVRVVDQLFNEFGHIENNRRYAQYIDLNIVANTTIRDYLARKFNEEKEKICVIIHGVDVNGEFDPETISRGKDPADGKFTVSFLGRFSEEKCPGSFVEIAARLKDIDDIRFVMIGDGPEFPNVKNQIEALGLTDRVFTPGFVEDVKPFLAQTDVLVIPSRIEGIPIVLLEGLSLGIPVVASNVGGIPSIITEGQNGFICYPGDIKSFAEKIKALHAQEGLRASVSKRARNYALENLDLDKMFKRYRDALEGSWAADREEGYHDDGARCEAVPEAKPDRRLSARDMTPSADVIENKDRAATIFIDYLPDSKPRYGYGKPPHKKLTEILDANREVYKEYLTKFMGYRDYYKRIRRDVDLDSGEPAWINEYLPGLDAIAIYGFLSVQNPRRFFEIGSGNSTKFARRAIKDQGLRTEIISVDPRPRAEIDRICDHVFRQSVESMDMEVFNVLEEGDILFIDNSHRSFMNSDVTVAFLDILPVLRKGVLVEFHDILLPYDYPIEWKEMYYSEQYLLASYLLAEGGKFEVVLPNFYISSDHELNGIIAPLWREPEFTGVDRHGASFWLRIK